MRPEIKNELLLQVIQAWDPSEADKWELDEGMLENGGWIIRCYDGRVEKDVEVDDKWYEACKLVEFILKDRPDLPGSWPRDIVQHCYREWDMVWGSDPFLCDSCGSSSKKIVARIKSYEYLREWKEKQEGYMKIETPSVAGAMVFRPNGPKTISDFTGGELTQQLLIHTDYPITIVSDVQIRLKGSVNFDMKPGETLSLTNYGGVWCESARTWAIDPSDVTLSIEGQKIEGMEICDDVLGVPATYEKICPHCNGSKEVVGWGGKERCRAC